MNVTTTLLAFTAELSHLQMTPLLFLNRCSDHYDCTFTATLTMTGDPRAALEHHRMNNVGSRAGTAVHLHVSHIYLYFPWHTCSSQQSRHINNIMSTCCSPQLQCLCSCSMTQTWKKYQVKVGRERESERVITPHHQF